MDFLGRENFRHQWKYALGFRWRGTSLDDLQAAWMAATAYASATDGIIFAHEAGKSLTLREAREVVDEIVRNIPRVWESLVAIRGKVQNVVCGEINPGFHFVSSGLAS